MSLLLDALKKAEKEKQRVLEAEAAGNSGAGASAAIEPITSTPVSARSSSQSQPVQTEPAEEIAPRLEAIETELELVLDELPVAHEQAEPAHSEIAEQAAVKPMQIDPPLELEKSAATTSTVSDEALQLLVYKTNKRYRQQQKMIWGSLITTTLIILLAAGAYNYYGALEEVEALERKHKLAMQLVQSEPVTRRQIDAPAATIKAADVVPAAPPKQEPKQKAAASTVARPAQPVAATTQHERDFSIQKTSTEDPINTLLNEAWLAYNRADYTTAGRAYENVLRREAKNRDALLGMAAVAIKNNDYKKAKESYRLLLKLDPRDQVANAAMSNIDELTSGLQDESKLKFMLQQQPDATHLNYALGNYYAKTAKWPEAQAAYFKAWQGNADNADYVYNLAVSLDHLGKTEEALRFYKESLLLADQQNISFVKSDVEKRIESISVK